MIDPQNTQIYFIISVGILSMLMMSGAIIVFIVFYQKRMIKEQMKRQVLEFQFQQRMMQAELESQESERRKLAADLHDSIGGMLSTIRVGITTAAKQLNTTPNTLDQTKQMLDDTISSVRRISRDLMPSTLEKFGLMQAMKELAERFQATSAITITFESNHDSTGLDKNRELMIFRIVQELLNNAVKHAKASEIKINLVIGQALKVSVEDNGVGFNAEEHKRDTQSGKGLGLFNIENRARLLNGNIEYDKNRLTGSKITLTMPFHARS